LKSKKEVLFISPQPFFQWRGSPIRVNFNLLGLTKLGYRVDLLTLPVGEDKDYDGATIIRVANPLSIKNVPIGPSVYKLFFDALIFLKGCSLCRKKNYQVIHGIEEAGLLAVVLAKLFGAKSIFEKHSDPFSYKKGFFKNCILYLYSLVEKITVKWCDGVIGTGEGLVSQVNNMGYSTRAFHIFDIPSSMEEPSEEMIAARRSTLVMEEGECIVTFVGSFALYQGVDLMFETIPQVVSKSNTIRFVIVGGKSEEIEERRNILKQKGADTKVSFLGKIAPDILPEYLYASDILLSPRISGVNTPLKILDYMKAGKPIVATDVASHRLILDETTGVFAKPEPEYLSQAILNLVSNKEKQEQLGSSGRHLYETKFNFENYKRQLSECYGYVLSNGAKTK